MDYELQTERVALHEAAHALVAHYSETLAPIRFVCVRADAPGHGAACTEGINLQGESADRGIYEVVRMMAAGAIAELLVGVGVDAAVAHSEKDIEKIIGLTRLAAHRSIPERKRADPAMREAGHQAAMRMVRRACASAELALRARWGAVERIAQWMLAADGLLPGFHVREVIAAAPQRSKPTTEARLFALLRDAAGDPQVEAGVRAACATTPRRQPAPGGRNDLAAMLDRALRAA